MGHRVGRRRGGGGLPYGMPVLDFVLGFAIQSATLGFLGGVGFSVAVGIMEVRHRFEGLSPIRFGAWGALGGLVMWVASSTVGHTLMHLLWTVGIPNLGWVSGVSGWTFVVLGAACASGSLALAQTSELGPADDVAVLPPEAGR